ncbi:MAG TPA: aldehyde dehydrogenase, partial [Tistrella mobilis]|nr:aldehyde dehydrogenase [Tistrella mobilis]
MINIATTRMNRRSFLKAGAAVTGGLVVSLALPLGTRPADAAAAARFDPNAFIRIDHQGIATLVMPMVEMGQGVYQGQAMLIAEELEIGLDQVRLEHAPADPAYTNPLIGGQITGGSTTIRAMW